jgi:Zn-dependent M28 family amino/carboxypeptidase
VAGAAPLKRTLRVMMFGAEEMDFTNDALTKAYSGRTDSLVAVSEIDEGADNVWSVQLPKDTAALPEMKTLAASLAPLNIFVSPTPAAGGGSDIRGLIAAGAPSVVFHQDASRYFDWHHSSEDTLDKIDPAQLSQNVAAWAAFLTIVGDSDVSLRAPPLSRPAAAKP